MRTRGTAATLLVGLAALVAVGAVYLWVARAVVIDPRIPPPRAELAKQRSDEVPDPEDNADDDTVAYLRGDGAFALTVHEIALAQIASGGDDVAQCRAQIDQLNARGSQAVAVEVILSVPDEPLRAFLEAEQDQLALRLARCVEPALVSQTDDPTAALTDAAALVEVRLNVVGWK